MNPLEENVAGIPPLDERVSYLNGRFVVGGLCRLARQGFCQYERSILEFVSELRRVRPWHASNAHRFPIWHALNAHSLPSCYPSNVRPLRVVRVAHVGLR